MQMKIDQKDLIGELERLAEACPWDRVDLWIIREPEGEYSFTTYVAENRMFGFQSVYGHGKSPQQAVDDVLRQCDMRDPEYARRKKIAELKEQIEKLQAVVIGLPPWKPNRELSITVSDPVVNV